MNRKIKKIGKGWQYTVYDIGNSRVRKVFNTNIQSISAMLVSCFPYFRYSIFNFLKYYKNLKRKAEKSINWFNKSDINLELFANPVFIGGLCYEQDIVVPVQGYIKNISNEKIKDLIGKFIKLNKYLIDINVVDQSFNFCKNFGINEKGNLVLIDLGELITDKDEIRIHLEKRPWASSYVNRAFPKQVKKYFIKEMDKNFLVK